MAHLNSQGSLKHSQIVCIQLMLIVIMLTYHSDAKVRCPNQFATFNHQNRTYYECPSIYQLQSYTSCCHDKDECCPPPMRFHLGLFQLIIVGSILCAIFIVSFVLCVFHPSCLFYNSIRTRHTKDKTSYAHKMGETSSLFNDMPGENTTGDTVIIPQPLHVDSNVVTFDSGGHVACDSSGGGDCGSAF